MPIKQTRILLVYVVPALLLYHGIIVSVVYFQPLSLMFFTYRVVVEFIKTNFTLKQISYITLYWAFMFWITPLHTDVIRYRSLYMRFSLMLYYCLNREQKNKSPWTQQRNVLSYLLQAVKCTLKHIWDRVTAWQCIGILISALGPDIKDFLGLMPIPIEVWKFLYPIFQPILYIWINNKWRLL